MHTELGAFRHRNDAPNRKPKRQPSEPEWSIRDWPILPSRGPPDLRLQASGRLVLQHCTIGYCTSIAEWGYVVSFIK